jgi:hypothetical protein
MLVMKFLNLVHMCIEDAGLIKGFL